MTANSEISTTQSDRFVLPEEMASFASTVWQNPGTSKGLDTQPKMESQAQGMEATALLKGFVIFDASKDKAPADVEFDKQRAEAKKEWGKLLPKLEEQQSFKDLTEVQKNIAKVLAQSVIEGSPILAGVARDCLAECDKAGREKITKAATELLKPLKIGVEFHHNSGELYIRDNTGSREELITVRKASGLNIPAIERVELRELLVLTADLGALSRRITEGAKKSDR